MAVAAITVLVGVMHPAPVVAHGVLVDSNPGEGDGLDETPTAIVLSFSEEPEPSLASISLTDEEGRDVAVGVASVHSDDPRSIVSQVTPLEEGVYTVAWRIVSRVDGHATAGAFAFGVGVTPDQAQLERAARDSPDTGGTALELVARWLFLAGIVVVLGAAIAVAASVVGTGISPLLAGGWASAVVGLIALAVAQRSSARVPIDEFLDTYAGRAILWRGGFLVAAGALAAAGHVSDGSIRRRWSLAAALALSGCVAVHVKAGHAAAAPSARTLALAAQWLHIAGAAAWLGGLLALVVWLQRGRRIDAGAGTAVRRFSTIAAGAFVLVATTGTVRAIATLDTPSDLLTTSYGRAAGVKIVAFVALGVIGLAQRRRSVAAASSTTDPLRRLARPELTLATGAILASGFLGSLSPPADVAPAGLSVRASDASGQFTAELTMRSRLPGPNTFGLTVIDRPDDVSAFDDVTLRFRPLDDPGVPSTTLRLTEAEDGYGARGSNLSFAGRWEVTLVAQRDERSWTVPFTVTTHAPPLFSTRTDIPGFPPEHIVQLPDNGFIVVSPFPDSDELTIRFADFTTAPRTVERLVATVTDRDGQTIQLAIERESEASFRAALEFPDEPFVVGVVARDPLDRRLYATFEIDPDAPDL